jgi:hypothetical protein
MSNPNTMPVTQLRAAAKKAGVLRGNMSEERMRKALKAARRDAIRVPSKGTLLAKVWDGLNKIGLKATAEDARKLASKRGWNQNTVIAEYYHWRKHHGIFGRLN